MKPIFTIHAGEYLVGDLLERKFKQCEIWLPSKDTGTDLLITNKKDRSKSLGIQVKFSKDFLPAMNVNVSDKLLSCGWWTLNIDKIIGSNADLWILAPYSFKSKHINLVIISPTELAKRLEQIHGKPKTLNTYLWITKANGCFETRGIRKKPLEEYTNSNFADISEERNFSTFLNDWSMFNKVI